MRRRIRYAFVDIGAVSVLTAARKIANNPALLPARRKKRVRFAEARVRDGPEFKRLLNEFAVVAAPTVLVPNRNILNILGAQSSAAYI